jgi:hypothetical protein
VSEARRIRWPWREALVVAGVWFLAAAWATVALSTGVAELFGVGAALVTAGALALWRR